MTGRKKSVSRKKSGGRQKSPVGSTGGKKQGTKPLKLKEHMGTYRGHLLYWDAEEGAPFYNEKRHLVYEDGKKVMYSQGKMIRVHLSPEQFEGPHTRLRDRVERAKKSLELGMRSLKDQTLRGIHYSGEGSDELRYMAKEAAESDDISFKDRVLAMYIHGHVPGHMIERSKMDEKIRDMKRDIKAVWEERFGIFGATGGGQYITIEYEDYIEDGQAGLKVTWNRARIEIAEFGNPIESEKHWFADKIHSAAIEEFGVAEHSEVTETDSGDFVLRLVVPEVAL